MNLTPLKRSILLAAARANEGHIASAFSVLDLLWVLYDQILRVDPRDPEAADRDRFVLSKGHASLALYAVLIAKGFCPGRTLDEFASLQSIFGGHPDRNKIPGVEASTGSLGHGFPMAVGMALGLRHKKSPARVFALIGDGEANEGSIWESILLAAHHRLNRLCCIVDHNHSTDRALKMDDLKNKFEAFDWEALDLDGHDHVAIAKALTREPGERPRAFIARTVKGCGCKPMENNPAWHHRAPTAEELPALLESLT